MTLLVFKPKVPTFAKVVAKRSLLVGQVFFRKCISHRLGGPIKHLHMHLSLNEEL